MEWESLVLYTPFVSLRSTPVRYPIFTINLNIVPFSDVQMFTTHFRSDSSEIIFVLLTRAFNIRSAACLPG